VLLDLRNDYKDVYAHLVERVRSFDLNHNQGPGNGKSITSINFGFQCDQDGWVALVFDTRPDAEPDGEWNSYIKDTLFARPTWLEASLALETEAVDVILPNGMTCAVAVEDDFERFIGLFGELLKSVLLKARADGIFKLLPTAKECHISVEEHDGQYAWPSYKDRGKEDLV
jgi:hypothetical protein